MNTFDKFDTAYREKISNAVWDAIEAASRDPRSGLSPKRAGGPGLLLDRGKEPVKIQIKAFDFGWQSQGAISGGRP